MCVEIVSQVSTCFSPSAPTFHSFRLADAKRLATLTGHERKITAAAFSNNSPCSLLCTASSDAVLLWGLSDGSCARLLDEPPETPTLVSFSPTNQFLAMCIGSLVYVATPADSAITAVLEGHAGTVTAAAFGTAHPSLLVSADDDRRFKVWDVAKHTLLFQSQYESPTPFTAASFDAEGVRLFLGSSDGSMHVFHMEGTGVCRRIAAVDCKRAAARLLSDAQHSQSAGTGTTSKPDPAVKAQQQQQQQQQQRGLTREVTMQHAFERFGVSSTQAAAPKVVSTTEAFRRQHPAVHVASGSGVGAVTVAANALQAQADGSTADADADAEQQGLSDDLLDADMTVLAIGRLSMHVFPQEGTSGSTSKSKAALHGYLKTVAGLPDETESDETSGQALDFIRGRQTLMAVATSQALLLVNCHTLTSRGVYRWARAEDWAAFPGKQQQQRGVGTNGGNSTSTTTTARSGRTRPGERAEAGGASAASVLPASIASCFMSSTRVVCSVCDVDMACMAVAGAFQRAVHIATICPARSGGDAGDDADDLDVGGGGGGGGGGDGLQGDMRAVNGTTPSGQRSKTPDRTKAATGEVGGRCGCACVWVSACEGVRVCLFACVRVCLRACVLACLCTCVVIVVVVILMPVNCVGSLYRPRRAPALHNHRGA